MARTAEFEVARRATREGWHVITAPFRQISRYWIAGGAWGTTPDQPRYAFIVTTSPDDDAKARGFYYVPRTTLVAQVTAGRNTDEEVAARDGFRTLGALVIDSTSSGPIMRLPFEARSFDERVRDALAIARQWVAEKEKREREERETASERKAADHARKVGALRRGAKVRVAIEAALPGWGVTVDGTFEEWDGRVAIIRMIPPGHKRRGLYRVPAGQIGLP